MWGSLSNVVRFASVAVTLVTVQAVAQDQPQGITQRTTFAPFKPSQPPCHKPPGLKRELAYVQESDREFLQGVNNGLSMAAKDRGLVYRRSLADNDVTKAIAEIEAFRAEDVGAVVATSSDPIAVASHLQNVIWSGAFVGTVVPPPATLLLNAPPV